jgi:hypothetical protein
MDGGENAGLKDPRTEQRTDSEQMPGTQNKERTPGGCPESTFSPKGAPSKIRSHFRANNNLFCKKTHTLRAQTDFFEKNLVYLKNL